MKSLGQIAHETLDTSCAPRRSTSPLAKSMHLYIFPRHVNNCGHEVFFLSTTYVAFLSWCVFHIRPRPRNTALVINAVSRPSSRAIHTFHHPSHSPPPLPSPASVTHKPRQICRGYCGWWWIKASQGDVIYPNHFNTGVLRSVACTQGTYTAVAHWTRGAKHTIQNVVLRHPYLLTVRARPSRTVARAQQMKRGGEKKDKAEQQNRHICHCGHNTRAGL